MDRTDEMRAFLKSDDPCHEGDHQGAGSVLWENTTA